MNVNLVFFFAHQIHIHWAWGLGPGGRGGLVGRAVGGQGERDAQTVRVVEAGLRGAVVGGGDGVDDGEAETGPGRAVPARPAAVEAVEDTGELRRRHAGAVVADLDGDAAVAPGGGQGGRRVARGVRADVGEQVVDGPAEQFLVARGGQVGRDVGVPGP